MLAVSSAGACYHFREVHKLLDITVGKFPTRLSPIHSFGLINSQN
jgi:hypothetical protein